MLQRRLQPLGSVQLAYSQIQGPQRRPGPSDFEEVMKCGEKEKRRNRRSKGIKQSRQKASEAGGGCPCAARAGLMEEL